MAHRQKSGSEIQRFPKFLIFEGDPVILVRPTKSFGPCDAHVLAAGPAHFMLSNS